MGAAKSVLSVCVRDKKKFRVMYMCTCVFDKVCVCLFI